MYQVVVRLADGGVIGAGAFASQAEAKARAEEIVRAARSDLDEWPVVGEAFVRPGAIISVGLVEGASTKWMGSETRSRWAREDDTGGAGGASPAGER